MIINDFEILICICWEENNEDVREEQYVHDTVKYSHVEVEVRHKGHSIGCEDTGRNHQTIAGINKIIWNNLQTHNLFPICLKLVVWV